jgi:hypothetical protein
MILMQNITLSVDDDDNSAGWDENWGLQELVSDETDDEEEHDKIEDFEQQQTVGSGTVPHQTTL